MLLLGTVNETHYMLSIQHTATAMDDEVVFRIVGTEYNVNLEVLSKALTEHPGGSFTLPMSSESGACVQT